jgi:hypothetical protein
MRFSAAHGGVTDVVVAQALTAAAAAAGTATIKGWIEIIHPFDPPLFATLAIHYFYPPLLLQWQFIISNPPVLLPCWHLGGVGHRRVHHVLFATP